MLLHQKLFSVFDSVSQKMITLPQQAPTTMENACTDENLKWTITVQVRPEQHATVGEDAREAKARAVENTGVSLFVKHSFFLKRVGGADNNDGNGMFVHMFRVYVRGQVTRATIDATGAFGRNLKAMYGAVQIYGQWRAGGNRV